MISGGWRWAKKLLNVWAFFVINDRNGENPRERNSPLESE